MNTDRRLPSFEVKHISETMIVLIDLDNDSCAPSVTNAADAVVEVLKATFPGGLRSRKIYYRDTEGRIDRICISKNEFSGFIFCSLEKQKELSSLIS